MPPVRSYPATVRVEPSRCRQVAISAWETRGSAPEGVRSGGSSRRPTSRSSSGTRPGSRVRPASSAGRVIDSRSSARDIGGSTNSPPVKTGASSGRSRQFPEKSARTPSTTTAGSCPAGGAGPDAASAQSTRTNARRSSSSEQSVNSSSNWSTSSTGRTGGGRRSPEPAGGRSDRRWTASSSACGRSRNSRAVMPRSLPRTFAAQSSSSSSGCAVGVNRTTGHVSAPGIGKPPPRRSAGTRPALSSEDLPAPDGATSISGPTPTRPKTRSTSSAVARSRPKNHSASRAVKAGRPRYGHSPSAGGPVSAGPSAPASGAPVSRTIRSSSPPACNTSSQRRATSTVTRFEPVSILLR